MPLPDEITHRRRDFTVACGGNLVATLAIWTAYLVTIRDTVLALEPAWLSLGIAEAARFTAFLLPTILAVVWNPQDRFRNYRDMFGHLRSGLVWGVTLGVGLIALNVLAAGLLGKLNAPSKPQLRSGTSMILSWAILFEELTYRGYMFRNLKDVYSGWLAGLVSATAFVLIHVPGWLLVMHLPPDQIVRHATSILVLGLLLAFALHRSRSIYAPLLVHGANNFASIVFRI